MELIKVENGMNGLDQNTTNLLADLERQAKTIKEKQDEIKKAILEEMENKNIIKLETDVLTITYIAPTDRETFDSKSFKAEHQDLYDEYVKMSPVKSSIRIKVKQ